MKIYRFIGSDTTLSLRDREIRMRQFGQAVELTEEEAAERIADGAPLLTDAEFAAKHEEPGK
jgi:hypothetical protein